MRSMLDAQNIVLKGSVSPESEEILSTEALEFVAGLERRFRDRRLELLEARRRRQSEFDEGHVEGAVLIPHDELPERLSEVLQALGGDKTKPIVVYCHSGRRSGIAKEALTGDGYTQVSNLGGYADWCEDC